MEAKEFDVQVSDPDFAEELEEFYDTISNLENDNPNCIRKLLLQETLGYDEDVNFLKIQSQLSLTHYFLQDAFFEHFAAFTLFIILGFLIASLLQLSRDPIRFNKKDFDERIELVKIKFKL